MMEQARTLSDDELDAILARAATATPGPWFTTRSPWFLDSTGIVAGSPDGNIGYVIADCDPYGSSRDEYEGPFKLAEADHDAAHIAGADPQTIIAVVTELKARRAAS